MTPKELYSANENLVYYVIKTFFPKDLEDDDVKQIGRLGLWKACLGYKENNGLFSCYAVASIRNNILNDKRVKKIHENDIPLSTFTYDNSYSTSVNAYDENYNPIECTQQIVEDYYPFLEDFDEFFKSITKTEFKVLKMLYSGYNAYDIANKLGFSKQRSYQLIGNIKNKAKKYHLKEKLYGRNV